MNRRQLIAGASLFASAEFAPAGLGAGQRRAGVFIPRPDPLASLREAVTICAV